MAPRPSKGRVRHRSYALSSPWSIAALLLGFGSCAGREPEPVALGPQEIRIPKAEEWVDRGRLFEAGGPGDWDQFLWGGFTATAVRLRGEYLLFYQGSSTYREEYDPTVCGRSIGLAYGHPEGPFQKHGDAPVVTWSPTNGCEEGAAAGAAVVSRDEVLLYYGANTLVSRTKVTADIRLARSDDGRSFRDEGVVIAHEDDRVWGHGDELFPLLAFADGSSTLVYYVPNGTLSARQLGVAIGLTPDRLSETRRVLDPVGRPVRVWGPAGYGRVGPELVAIFLKDGPQADMEVRLLDPALPDRVSAPVEAYSFDDVHQATVILDEDRGSWLMFYRGDGYYGLKTAPVGPADTGRSGR